MKKILGILMMVVSMMAVSTNVCAQAPNQKQRLSREQLAEKQAQYIAHDLSLDDKTCSKFIGTYTECQKEVWALGPRPHHKKGEVKTDAQTEQDIKMSEKILNIRQKYYKKYSQFLTQQQIQRVYEIERQMKKRFAQKGLRKGMGKNGKPMPGKKAKSTGIEKK